MRARSPSSFSLAEARVGLLFAVPALGAFLLLVVYPVAESIRLSFFKTDVFKSTERYVGLDNYAQVLADPELGPAVLNSFVWTAGSLAGQIVIGLAAALLINREFRGATVVRLVLLMPFVVPLIAVALLWRWMLDGQFGVLSQALEVLSFVPPDQSPLGIPSQAMPALVAINVWRSFPFAMLIYWAALRSIPIEQYEAARLDGASVWQEFLHITLPYVRSATVALLVLRGIWTFTHFDLIWLTTGGGPAKATEVITTYVYHVALGQFNYGYASAIACLTAVVMVLVGGSYLVWRRPQAGGR